MTTYKGIAAVTQTLGYLVGAAIRDGVPESTVTLARPEESPAGAANEPRVNIYLVQVWPEPTMRSNDLPTRNGSGSLVSVPQAPVNLRYLLSFFGPSEKAHLMLGATEVMLRESAVLDPTVIRQALINQPQLADSGLDTQIPPVRMVPAGLTLEELSRFWAGFLQMPYTVSTVYDAKTVILSSTSTAGASLPVLSVGGGVTGPPPQLDPLPTVQFISQAPGTTVPVTGRGLAIDQQVQVAERWVALTATSPEQFTFALPSDILAGVQVVRLGAPAADGSPQPIAGSEPQTLRIRPQLQRVSPDQTGASVSVTVAPAVAAGQRAVLSLVGTATGGAPVPSVQVSMVPAALSTQLAFTVPSPLPAGEYLALLEIDGVTSLPTLQNGRYTQPIVQLA